MIKAARIHAYGDDPVVEDAPVPRPGPGEVLVRVAAASLNPLDVQVQRGEAHGYFPVGAFPYVLGTDLAGTIERTGPGVTGWSPGDRVVARLDPERGGALAELAAVPADQLVRVPGALSLRTAAGIPTTGVTAWRALFELGGLVAGQRVLVHAGAGGVGSFAIQLARWAGAAVTATASGTGVDIARRLGAAEVVDHRSEDFADRLSGLDLVVDTVGGDTQRRSFAVLRPGGTLISTVAPPDEDLAAARGAATVGFVFHTSDAGRLRELVARVADGTEVLVDRTVALEELGAAFAYVAAGHARGKVLVTP